MEVDFECLSCMTNFTLRVISLCTNNKEERLSLARFALQSLADADYSKTPVEIANDINQHTLKETNVSDPFLEIKRERNKRAFSILDQVKEKIYKSEDPLLSAIMVATAGNILDTVAGDEKALKDKIDEIFYRGFAKNAYSYFLKVLEKADKILYIADNAGEIFFDKLLVEILHHRCKKIVFCVRGGPSADDALEEDFVEASLQEYSSLITTGTSHQGCPLHLVSKKFLEEFKKADLIIAKGMGNYETLGDLKDERLFLLLVAKCIPIARKIGVKIGDFCFLSSKNTGKNLL